MTTVIDPSVTTAWCFEDEDADATDAVLERLRDDRGVVSARWLLEVPNVLLVSELAPHWRRWTASSSPSRRPTLST